MNARLVVHERQVSEDRENLCVLVDGYAVVFLGLQIVEADNSTLERADPGELGGLDPLLAGESRELLDDLLAFL